MAHNLKIEFMVVAAWDDRTNDELAVTTVKRMECRVIRDEESTERWIC